ncbi:hypothetical protein, conserved [Eimeria necatrix]|uniref:Uncharacterized protein n=1 Tax=Eimeria necatrix TaxID=51315 RepID=U6N2H6_9EIME|nr:hypothetical protein, conserved [Eimeria necatrix]CDJ68125.1 hypothetical protein, conserved [Eimeria necatrix]
MATFIFSLLLLAVARGGASYGEFWGHGTLVAKPKVDIVETVVTGGAGGGTAWIRSLSGELQLSYCKNSSRLAAASRTGVAVPEDIRDFGRLNIYHWLKPTLTQQQLQQLEEQHQQQQQQQQQQPGGLLGALSYFYDFDLHLQRVGHEAYYRGAAIAMAEAEAEAAETAREALTTAEAKPVNRPVPFSVQHSLPVSFPEDLTLAAQQQEQQQPQAERPHEQEEVEEPQGGGLLLEVWLPGVDAADIKVQLAWIGRQREAETDSGFDPPRASSSVLSDLSRTHTVNAWHWPEETVSAAEERITNRLQPRYPPPLLPSLIINAPKSSRVLKWEAETFKTRFRQGRGLEYQRYQRAVRLTWPAAWERAESRFDCGRLLVVVPPLPTDADKPDLLQHQELSPIVVPVQELSAPLPPYPGFFITNTRLDWTFNFSRFPHIYDLSDDAFAIKRELQDTADGNVQVRAEKVAASTIKPKVRVVTKKNWKIA